MALTEYDLQIQIAESEGMTSNKPVNLRLPGRLTELTGNETLASIGIIDPPLSRILPNVEVVIFDNAVNE